MKTEDLQRYEQMYREMSRLFRTPLLTFEHPPAQEPIAGERSRRPGGGAGLRAACRKDTDL